MKKQSSRTPSGCRLTAVATVTAGNALVDPVFIFEGARVTKDELLSLKCLPVGTKWTMTQKGYMTDDTWENVVVPHLINQAAMAREMRGKPEQWILLVMDGFGAHLLFSEITIKPPSS